MERLELPAGRNEGGNEEEYGGSIKGYDDEYCVCRGATAAGFGVWVICRTLPRDSIVLLERVEALAKEEKMVSCVSATAAATRLSVWVL